MARALLSYAAHSGENRFAQRAETMLRRFARDYQSFGLFASGYASAVLDITDAPIDVHVVGAAEDSSTRSLLEAALRTVAPPLRIDPLDPSVEKERATALGYGVNGATAYLCRGKTCFARTSTPAELLSALNVPVR
jgi:uncharacterized protein YyaL (SSP411 family)